MQLCSKPGGGTRNRTRDLPKKGSAFIPSSDHWTLCHVAWKAHAQNLTNDPGSHPHLTSRASML